MSLIRRAILILVTLPVAAALIALSVANRQPVVFSLDPLGGSDPALSVEVPLFILLLGVLILGAVSGGIAAWLNQGKWRRTARVKRSEAARWKHEAREIQRQAEHTATTALPAPGDTRNAA